MLSQRAQAPRLCVSLLLISALVLALPCGAAPSREGRLADPACSLYPSTRVRALHEEGYWAYHTQLYPLASRRLSSALREAPDFVPSLVRMAQVQHAMGDLAMAARLLGQARSAVLSGPRGRQLLVASVAAGLSAAGLDEAALLRARVNDSPRDSDALTRLGALAERNGQPKEAEGLYLRAASATPSYFPALHALARLWSHEAKPEPALRLSRRVLALAPSGWAYRFIGALEETTGDLVGARRAYLRGQQSDGDESLAQLRVAWTWMKQGDLSQAWIWAGRSLAHAKGAQGKVRARLVMAEACRLKQNWSGLMSISDELRRTPGAGVEVAMLHRGLALVGMRRLPEARDLLSRARGVLRRRAGASSSWTPELHDLAAEISAESGDLPAACREARTAVEVVAARGGEVGEGRHPLLYYHRRLGDFLRRRGQLGEAMHWYARCLTQDPGDGLALFGTAIVMEKRGDRAGALQRYSRFLRLWARAPTSIPEVRCARAYLAEAAAASRRSR